MKKRITWLDFSKGITILFVVIGHGLSTIYESQNINSKVFIPLLSIVFTFIMPCFFAISGYLYKPIDNIQNYKLMIGKKLINLGIPYLLFSVIYVIIQNLGGNGVNYPINYNSLLDIYSTPISYLWFLYSLFFIFLIVGMLDLLNINSYLQIIIYICLTIIGITFNLWPWSSLKAIFTSILFFYVGNIISKSINNFIFYKIMKSSITTIVLVIVFIALLIIQSFYSVGISTENTSFSNIFTKLVSIVLLINISIKLPKGNFYNYFVKYGKLTLIIYLVHAPIISTLRLISLKIVNLNNITSIFLLIFLIIITWYLSIFVCYLSNKFNIIHLLFYP